MKVWDGAGIELATPGSAVKLISVARHFTDCATQPGIVQCTYLGVSGYNFQKTIVFFCLKIFFTFTRSVDPDEMQHYAAFHLGLRCLQKYSFRGFPNTKI